jgi:hypothetical protein
MTAEMKFDTESLLDKKLLSHYDPMLFDVLITALQDDLSSHKRLLDQYSFEKNPGLQFLVQSPAPLTELEGLPQLMKEWGCDESLTEAEVGESEDADTLRHEKLQLCDQMSKLEFDYEQLSQQLEMERESHGVEGRKLTGKARKIELLMESNKENLKRISDANAELKKKDEIIATQELLTKKFIREKDALMSDKMAANREVGVQRARNKELRMAVETLQKELRSVQRTSAGEHTLNLALVHSVCLKNGVVDPVTLRKSIPANFMDHWIGMSNATVVIQSAIRGTLSRIALAQRFGRAKIVSWSERQDLDFRLVKPSTKRTVEDYQAMGLSSEHAAKAVATNMRDPEQARTPFSMPTLMERFPATCALAQLSRFSGEDQKSWTQVPELLKIVKSEVCQDLKNSTKQELDTMKEEMVRYGCRMLRQVTVKTKESRPQAVQAGAPLSCLHEIEMQTDDEPPAPEDGKKKK